MEYANLAYPATTAPADVLATYRRNQMEQLPADVLAQGAYPGYALRFFEERGITVTAEDGDLEALAAHTADFVCFSYYLTQLCSAESVAAGEQGNGDTFQNPLLEANPWGWAIDPTGLRWTLNVYQDRYHKPLYIVENGCGYLEEPGDDGIVHDPYRVQFFHDHIEAAREAVRLVVPGRHPRPGRQVALGCRGPRHRACREGGRRKRGAGCGRRGRACRAVGPGFLGRHKSLIL
jgi:6-phospho-beta-glucosidase